MKDGFIKVAAGSVAVTVGNPQKNAQEIIRIIRLADQSKANLLVLPELCITGYTCGDLFYNNLLLDNALEALGEICTSTENTYPTVIAGLPIKYQNKLFNCAAVFSQGSILGIVPQKTVKSRQFTSSAELTGNEVFFFNGEEIPFGTDLLFQHDQLAEYCFGVEIGEDVWAQNQAAERLTAAGAMIIASPSAATETVGTDEYRKLMFSANSARLYAGYVNANAGPEESTQDAVFSRNHLIAESGTILAENKSFECSDLLISEIDLQRLSADRQKDSGYQMKYDGCSVVVFSQDVHKTELTRYYEPNPFVPSDLENLKKRAESILQTQAYGLKKRLSHTYAKCAVIGISGGLDSTLALLVAVRAMKLLNRPCSDILAVTMPCFGTSSRTKKNALSLCKELGVELKEVDITKSVQQHFVDIGQDENNYDVTFENAQARERTQVLMDIANQRGGLLVGTGDLSELALGWATYNGDHMSMYGVNASVPKTLVRYLVRYEAEHSQEELRKTLIDIVDTPVSPELLPTNQDGEIAQKTEDLVGPYELHDFYLYHFFRFGFKPQKLLRLAKYTFGNTYTNEVLTHWLRTFLRRFFNQQFKRSCLPDGPKVGSVSLSPRGDLQMPTDASSEIWLHELEN
ncbi:MAG: NAD(+) synthase [Clostridia bacterium]|nr:NAD(+) synthase [Clostridia bacterium]